MVLASDVDAYNSAKRYTNEFQSKVETSELWVHKSDRVVAVGDEETASEEPSLSRHTSAMRVNGGELRRLIRYVMCRRHDILFFRFRGATFAKFG